MWNILYSCCYHCFPEILLPHINLNCFASHANCALWIQRQFITGFSRDLGKFVGGGREERDIGGHFTKQLLPDNTNASTHQNHLINTELVPFLHKITRLQQNIKKLYRIGAFSTSFCPRPIWSVETFARAGKLIGKRKQAWEGEKLYEGQEGGWVRWTGIKKS